MTRLGCDHTTPTSKGLPHHTSTTPLLLHHHYSSTQSQRPVVELSCPYCGKTMRYKSNLRKHIADMHSGVYYQFTCRVCNKLFRTKNSLLTHTYRQHPGAKANSGGNAAGKTPFSNRGLLSPEILASVARTGSLIIQNAASLPGFFGETSQSCSTGMVDPLDVAGSGDNGDRENATNVMISAAESIVSGGAAGMLHAMAHPGHSASGFSSASPTDNQQQLRYNSSYSDISPEDYY